MEQRTGQRQWAYVLSAQVKNRLGVVLRGHDLGVIGMEVLMKSDGSKPTPRLRHVRPGQIVYLAHENRPRLLLDIDDHFGYFEGLQASLGHEVKETGMVFGEGGWRVKDGNH